MRWYRDNRIMGNLLIAMALIIIFFVYKIIKKVGPAMGDEVKTEKQAK
jgi:hypothetical protein